MRVHGQKRERGFTLFEILISVVLLSAVGVVALSSFNNSTRMTTGKQNTATNLARQTLEDLKNAVRADWWTQNGQRLTPGTPAFQPTAATMDGIVFNPAYSVSATDPARTGMDVDQDGVVEDDEPRRVTINVNWTPT